ncbi:MAG: hypothetical protein GY799_06110 [Desulfobulbaceae bacterium]|nr:hypothetical protein [Desulfobulbaceae bacterium]
MPEDYLLQQKVILMLQPTNLQSLRSQGKKAEAEAIKTRFDNAWSKADIVLTASRIMANSANSSSKVAGK